MSDKLARTGRGSDLAAWQPEGARLEPELFRQGLALIAASQPRALDPETVAAYWLALASVEPEDFCEGTRLALQRERFMTPAALFEACADVRRERERQAAEARWKADRVREADEREQRHRAFETRQEALRAEAASWTTPPVGVEALRGRVLVLLELGRRPSLLFLARTSVMRGTVEDLVVVVEHASFFRNAARDLGEVASEAAGHPVHVTVQFKERA